MPGENTTVKASLPHPIVLLAVALLALTACPTPVTDGGKVLYVDNKLVDCFGVVPQTCMRVKGSESADWELLYQGLDGFEYEAGYSYKLLVKTTHIKNPPQDASSIRYELIKIIEKH